MRSRDERRGTAPTPAPLTDLSDAGLIAAIEADQIATRILAPEVQKVRAVTELDDEVAAWLAEAASRAADSPGRAPT